MSVCLCECVFVIKIRLQKISSSASPTADRVSERSSFVTGVVHRNHQKSLAPSRSGIKPGTNPFLHTVGHNASFFITPNTAITIAFFRILPFHFGLLVIFPKE